MANLTIAIDDDLLRRARQLALRENTSVNALVRQFLGSYVEVRSRRLAALSHFEVIATTINSTSSGSGSRRTV